MTASEPPDGPETRLEQEAIWDEAPDEGAGSSGPAAAGTSDASPRTSTGERAAAPAGLLYAEVPNRVIALVIDIIVLSLVGFVLAWLAGGLVSRPGAIDQPGGQLDVVAFVVVVVLQSLISMAYFGASWTLLGATAGMRLLGLRLGDESDGRLLGRRQVAIRWLTLGLPALLASLAVYVPDIIGLILGLLGLAWLSLLLYTMTQSPARQGLHDRYAHSIVVRARRQSG